MFPPLASNEPNLPSAVASCLGSNVSPAVREALEARLAAWTVLSARPFPSQLFFFFIGSVTDYRISF
jgi:hypothetical protein